MRYIKIKIIEFRDNQAYADLQQAAAELADLTNAADAQARQAAEIDKLAKASGLPGDAELAAAESGKAKAMASALITARMKVSNASEAHSRKAKGHAKVGSFGYQEIESGRMEVVRLLDERGQPFPPDAVFGYEVVDANPPMPKWGTPDPVAPAA
jgi:hypothetical protein